MKKLNDNVTVSQFDYNGIKYNKISNEQTGLIETKPSIKNELNIYETGHYLVKSYFFIPILINLSDLILTAFHLARLNISMNSQIVDFGCGKGYLIYFLKKIGFKKLSGIETSISRAKFAREITGLEICSKFYSGGQIMGEKQDCVILLHVLEHIEKPFEFLNKLITESVKNGGLVYIEVPNINSISSKIAGNTWAHFTPHFHINHFTLQSFKNFCLINNFEYKVVGTFSFYNSAIGMTSALLSLPGYKGSLFEDLKKKKILIIMAFLLLLPFTVLLEGILSIFTKKGSVIKFVIKN